MGDGKTNSLMAAFMKRSNSLIVAVNQWWLIEFIARFQLRTETRDELFTNYSETLNEKLTNTGLESLEKLNQNVEDKFYKGHILKVFIIDTFVLSILWIK